MDVDGAIYQKSLTGKLKRQRKKFHISAKKQRSDNRESLHTEDSASSLPLTPPKENLFAGINIDFDSLKKTLSDDVRSIKSYKSLKSESEKPILPKKEKIKLRRELLLKKIDTVNQMKKESKIREKRKKTAIIGDTNPLHDALPSLESLLNNKSSVKNNKNQSVSKKGIEKASKRKKKLVEGVKVFKQTLKNKDFQKNPFEAISSHLKAMVQQERSNNC